MSARVAIAEWKRRETRKRESAILYFVRGYDMVKIGWTTDLHGRLKGLQTGSPVLLSVLHTMPGGAAEESAHHERFKNYRAHGEWFRLQGALLEYVAALISPRRRAALLKPLDPGVDRRGRFIQEHLDAKRKAADERIREIDEAIARAQAEASKGP